MEFALDIYTCVAICFAVVGAIVVLALFSDVGDAVIRKKLHLPPALKEPNVKDKLIEYISLTLNPGYKLAIKLSFE